MLVGSQKVFEENEPAFKHSAEVGHATSLAAVDKISVFVTSDSNLCTFRITPATWKSVSKRTELNQLKLTLAW